MRNKDNGLPEIKAEIYDSDYCIPAQIFIAVVLAVFMIILTIIISLFVQTKHVTKPKSYERIFANIKRYHVHKLKPGAMIKTIVTTTSYNPVPEQTDSTPFITANGSRVRHGIIACNFLPFGSRVWIEGFGDDAFTVTDRTARKYGNRVDIFSFSKKWSMTWGKRQVRIAYQLPKEN